MARHVVAPRSTLERQIEWPRHARHGGRRGGAVPCGSIKPDFAVRHQMAEASETATWAMRRNLATPQFRLPDEGQKLPHPTHVTEAEVRELQVDVPGSRKAQSSEGLRKLVVVRDVELPADRNPDRACGRRDADAEGCGSVVLSVFERHS